jgi:hypothetical protein
LGDSDEWERTVLQTVTGMIDQRPTDLVLGIVRTEIGYPLRCLQQAECILGAWRVIFRIIGESHVARVEHDGRLVFQEILACIPLTADECHHWQPFDQVRVGFSSQIDEARPYHMEVRFPGVDGRKPVTRIGWQAQTAHLTWWTLHTYPQPEGWVYVQTGSTLDCS